MALVEKIVTENDKTLYRYEGDDCKIIVYAITRDDFKAGLKDSLGFGSIMTKEQAEEARSLKVGKTWKTKFAISHRKHLK